MASRNDLNKRWEELEKNYPTAKQIEELAANYTPRSNDSDSFYNFDKGSYLDNFIGSGLVGGADVASGVASFAGADDFADSASNFSQNIKGKLAPQVDADFSLNYFLSPGGFARSFGNAVGSSAVIAPAMLAVPESAGAAGAALLGRAFLNKAVGKLIESGAVGRGVAKSIAAGTPSAVRYGMSSAPLEAAAEGGNVRRELLESGASESDARVCW